MSDRGDLVESQNGTVHRSTGEVVFTQHGERTVMECGANLPGIGHPYNEMMVRDYADRGKLCGPCFDDWSGAE